MVEQYANKQLNEQSQSGDYSNNLLGRLKNKFDASQLVFIGGSFNGKVGKSRHFMPHLPRFPFSIDTKAEEVGRFNTAFPKIVEAMIGIRGEGLLEGNYVSEIGGCDYQNLPAIAANITLKAANERGIVIRVVYGATTEMPVRALSYILPALTFMDRLQKDSTEPPQLQVIFVNNISSILNDMNYSEVKKNESKKFVRVAEEYIHNFFPKLLDSAVFLEDTPLEKGTALRNGLLHVAHVLKYTAPIDVRQVLQDKGNNGSRRTNVFYGAAHILMHDINMDGLVSLTERQISIINPQTIISIGGYQEHFFYGLRQILKPYLGADYNQIKTLQFFTKHRVPPYYMARDGDIAFGTVLSQKNQKYKEIGRAAQYDLDYLKKVSSRRGNIEEFFEGQRSRYE